jgi:hypothetical protein
MSETWQDYEEMALKFLYPSDFEFENIEKAIEYFKKADQLGSPTAPIELYQLLFEENMGDSKARELIQRSLDRGHTYAYNWFAIYYQVRGEDLNKFKCGLNYLTTELEKDSPEDLHDAVRAFIINIPLWIDPEIWGVSVKNLAHLEGLFIEVLEHCIAEEVNPKDYKMRARRLGKVLDSEALSSH